MEGERLIKLLHAWNRRIRDAILCRRFAALRAGLGVETSVVGQKFQFFVELSVIDSRRNKNLVFISKHVREEDIIHWSLYPVHKETKRMLGTLFAIRPRNAGRITLLRETNLERTKEIQKHKTGFMDMNYVPVAVVQVQILPECLGIQRARLVLRLLFLFGRQFFGHKFLAREIQLFAINPYRKICMYVVGIWVHSWFAREEITACKHHRQTDERAVLQSFVALHN